MSVTTPTTRQRILTAATELFAANGYQGTGVAELESAVGLRRGALYHHIGNKQQLLYDIASRPIAVLNEVAAACMAMDAPALDRLRELARRHTTYIAENHAETRVLYQEWNWLEGDALELIKAERARFEGYWRDLVQAAVDEGALNPQHGVVVKGMLGMFHHTYVWYRDEGSLSPEEIADQLFDVLVYGMAPR